MGGKVGPHSGGPGSDACLPGFVGGSAVLRGEECPALLVVPVAVGTLWGRRMPAVTFFIAPIGVGLAVPTGQ